MMNSYHIFLTVLLLTLVCLQFRLWIGESSFAHVNDLRSEIELRTAENEVRRQRNYVLKTEILDLKHHLSAVEEISRSELGLIRKGETFFLLVED
tara:strand:- start:121 stop:405 length:285 start_codon:yes stop_codon:yes gene_type:complete